MGTQFHTVCTSLATKNYVLNVDVRTRSLAVLVVVDIAHPFVVALYAEVVVTFLCHAEISETHLIRLLRFYEVRTQRVAVHRHRSARTANSVNILRRATISALYAM